MCKIVKWECLSNLWVVVLLFDVIYLFIVSVFWWECFCHQNTTKIILITFVSLSLPCKHSAFAVVHLRPLLWLTIVGQTLWKSNFETERKYFPIYCIQISKYVLLKWQNQSMTLISHRYGWIYLYPPDISQHEVIIDLIYSLNTWWFIGVCCFKEK